MRVGRCGPKIRVRRKQTPYGPPVPPAHPPARRSEALDQAAGELAPIASTARPARRLKRRPPDPVLTCYQATGAAGCACDNREPPATIVNSGKKRAVGAAVWRLRALAEKPPPNPLGRDRHRPAEETERISPLTPWGAFCALEWGATPTCSAYRPPKSPGVFSTEAGRGDRCSPVMGSMTRVEPPGPGRRRHRDCPELPRPHAPTPRLRSWVGEPTSFAITVLFPPFLGVGSVGCRPPRLGRRRRAGPGRGSQPVRSLADLSLLNSEPPSCPRSRLAVEPPSSHSPRSILFVRHKLRCSTRCSHRESRRRRAGPGSRPAPGPPLSHSPRSSGPRAVRVNSRFRARSPESV